MKLKPDPLTNILNLAVEEHQRELTNQVKENWLIAWSIARSLRTCNMYITKTTKEVKFLLKKAEKQYGARENYLPKIYKEQLEQHLKKKGFQKE
jgi:hypothetical protein